jgi:hypothetical protein
VKRIKREIGMVQWVVKEITMLSALEFQFDARDAESRNRARVRFLTTALDRLRRVRQLIADQGADDLFVDLAVLQRVIPDVFSRSARGYPLPDPDMRESVIGPVGKALYMFKGIVADAVVRDFDKALQECEAKIGKELRAANAERRAHDAERIAR